MQNEIYIGTINTERLDTDNFDFTINNSRTSCNSIDTLSNTARDQGAVDITHKNIDNNSINIYRYKFTVQFMEELLQFSKIHQYDSRIDFKEAWNIWTEENDNIVTSEINRLTNLEYDGDILDKMYKSARYYFRKKSTEKKEPTKRREYINVSKELIAAMDQHIQMSINNDDYKPSDGFDDFCKNHVELLKQDINILCQSGFKNSEDIKSKFKKTYKNRYFLFISK